MRKIKFATILMSILLLFFVVYNTVFGWNKLPENEIEKTCDFIFTTGSYLSFFIYFLPLIDVYEDFIKRYELNKKN